MKIAHILVIGDNFGLDIFKVKKYCDGIMNKYGCDQYQIDSYTLEELQIDNFQQICASCYEGLFLSGIFTKEDLFWPIRRQRPKYKEVK